MLFPAVGFNLLTIRSWLFEMHLIWKTLSTKVVPQAPQFLHQVSAQVIYHTDPIVLTSSENCAMALGSSSTLSLHQHEKSAHLIEPPFPLLGSEWPNLCVWWIMLRHRCHALTSDARELWETDLIRISISHAQREVLRTDWQGSSFYHPWHY